MSFYQIISLFLIILQLFKFLLNNELNLKFCAYIAFTFAFHWRKYFKLIDTTAKHKPFNCQSYIHTWLYSNLILTTSSSFLLLLLLLKISHLDLLLLILNFTQFVFGVILPPIFNTISLIYYLSLFILTFNQFFCYAFYFISFYFPLFVNTII